MAARIAIVAYRRAWDAEYRTLAAPLRSAVPPESRLHHIGSTAVPGLAAKDVIDLQLTVARLADVDARAIEACGFLEVPGLSDHRPPGEAGAALAAPELAKLYFRSTGRRAHLHVREEGRFNQRYALLCRDFLRAHQGAARAYEAVKRALAARFPDDEDAYYAVKDPVFDLLMAGAQIWADASGWREPPAD
jgi:GrpB-like predicted nucleotidyltransferase (UPF0157 family)